MTTEYDLQALLKEIRQAVHKRIFIHIEEESCFILIYASPGEYEYPIIFPNLRAAMHWLHVWLEDTVRQQA